MTETLVRSEGLPGQKSHRFPLRGATVSVIAVCLLFVVGQAQAQINPFKQSNFDLTEADVEILSAAAAGLYKQEPPPVGKKVRWLNPGSGNGGAIKLVRAFERDGMPCRRLIHVILTRKSEDPHRFQVDRCRVADGTWKLLF